MNLLFTTFLCKNSNDFIKITKKIFISISLTCVHHHHNMRNSNLFCIFYILFILTACRKYLTDFLFGPFTQTKKHSKSKPQDIVSNKKWWTCQSRIGGRIRRTLHLWMPIAGSTQTQAHGCLHSGYIWGKILENRRYRGIKVAWRSVNHGVA